MTWAALWLEALALMSAPADLPPPRVVVGDRNFYMADEVHVVNDECFSTNFLHEASHYIAIKTGRLDGVPNDKVKDRLEEIARDVERRASNYAPNCETKDTAP